MWPDTQRDKDALDRYITGHYGEDEFKDGDYLTDEEAEELRHRKQLNEVD